MMDLADADLGHGLRVERSREMLMVEEDPHGSRETTIAVIEVEVSWVRRGGREAREVVDLLQFKEMVKEAERRGMRVALGPAYTHQQSAPAGEQAHAIGSPQPEERAPERPFDLLGLVRDLIRQERDSLGPAYG